MNKTSKILILVLTLGLVCNASAGVCREKLKFITQSSIAYGSKTVLQKAGKEVMSNVTSQFGIMIAAISDADPCVKFAGDDDADDKQLKFLEKCKGNLEKLSKIARGYGERQTQESLAKTSTPDTAKILKRLDRYEAKFASKCM